jgi:hypothetical protein
MKVAVMSCSDGSVRIVMSSGFRPGDWPLNVDERNIPCTCGYMGEGEIIQGFPACNDRTMCPDCGKDLDKEVEKSLELQA